MGKGSPRPSPRKSQIRASRPVSSTLLATTSTGVDRRRISPATWSSSSVEPTVASTINRITSASSSAASLWADTLASRSSPRWDHPPVSISTKRRPAQEASVS